MRAKFHWPENPGEWKRLLLALPDDPHAVALGFAIGALISFTPLIPFHMALSAALAALCRASKLTAVAGAYISNPLTIPFQYWAAYKTGALVWHYPVVWHPHGLSLAQIVNMGWEFAVEMVTGGVINGIIPALGVYYITRLMVRHVRQRSAR